MTYWIVKIVTVVGLLGGAAAIATPKGRVPLALRGVLKMIGKSGATTAGAPVDGWKKALAFLMVLAAAAVAMIGRS